MHPHWACRDAMQQALQETKRGMGPHGMHTVQAIIQGSHQWVPFAPPRALNSLFIMTDDSMLHGNTVCQKEGRQVFRSHLALRGGFFGEEVGVILVGEGLGLNQEVAQVGLEGAVLLQLKHARHARLRTSSSAHSAILLALLLSPA